MTNATKGALLSGLVLPGLGQIVLKRYKRGLTIILVLLSGLTIMVVKAAQLALAILEKMELENGGLDMQAITNAATQASVTSDNRVFNLCLLLIVVFWALSVVDAYMIGKKMDQLQAAGHQKQF